MMNKRIEKVLCKFALIFLVIAANVHSQNNPQTSVVTYKISINNNINKVDLSKSSSDKIKMIINSVELIECQLFFDNYSSVFQQVKKMSLEDDYSYKLASVFIRGINYTNIKTEKRILVKNISDQVFNISLPYNQYNWVITKETKKIGAYTCYKATSSKEMFNSITNKTKMKSIIAWFTPEIAVPFGPNGIDGLPGLILETTFNNNVTFYATEIQLNDTKENTIMLPSEGKEITEEEYLKLVHSKFSSLFD